MEAHQLLIVRRDASGNGSWIAPVKVKYCIVAFGVFPSFGNPGSFTQPVVGEIIAFAGNQVPTGCYLCDGSLVTISTNTALFSVIANTYGGNGTTSYALPNLINGSMTGY